MIKKITCPPPLKKAYVSLNCYPIKNYGGTVMTYTPGKGSGCTFYYRQWSQWSDINWFLMVLCAWEWISAVFSRCANSGYFYQLKMRV